MGVDVGESNDNNVKMSSGSTGAFFFEIRFVFRCVVTLSASAFSLRIQPWLCAKHRLLALSRLRQATCYQDRDSKGYGTASWVGVDSDKPETGDILEVT